MGYKKFKIQGKWNINDHAVVRFRQRVDPNIKRGPRRDIQRKIASALNAVNPDEIIYQSREVIYPVYFSYKGRDYGPYYCVAPSHEPNSIVTLLSELRIKPGSRSLEDRI